MWEALGWGICAFAAALVVEAAVEWWREPAEARRARKARLAAAERKILDEYKSRQKQQRPLR